MTNKHDFLWNVHSYTNEYIRFADTKAGVVVAWCCAMLSVLVAKKDFNHFINGLFCSSVFAWFSFLAFVLLGLAFVIAIRVVAPDLRTRSEHTGLIFWESIRQFKSDDDYREAVESEENLNRAVANHIFAIASVAKRKYWWVGVSIWLAAIGTIFAIFVLFGSESASKI